MLFTPFAARSLRALCVMTTTCIGALMTSDTHAQTWGSFDASRTLYNGAVLTTGSELDTLRGILTAGGANLATSTSTLTTQYLDTIDVFFTSALDQNNGTLSSDEQDALDAWLKQGGTLVVSADYTPLTGYNSFTAPYGISGYRLSGNQAEDGMVIVTHPLTSDVVSYRYAGGATFLYGSDAKLLGDTMSDDPFWVVLEPDTGFHHGGRIMVIGDHNMFTDEHIVALDNQMLARNMVTWAHDPAPNLCVDMPCPGPLTLLSSNNTPFGQVGFVYSFSVGSFTVPSGVCAGTQLALQQPTLAHVDIAAVDSTVSFTTSVPAIVCGSVFVQTVDAATCRVSNRITIE